MAVINLSEEKFDEVLSKSRVPVLLDFWTQWCGPCRMMAPAIEAVDEEMGGAVLIAKVDVDAYPDLAARFNIMSIPTVVIFENGEEKYRSTGMRSKEELLKALEL